MLSSFPNSIIATDQKVRDDKMRASFIRHFWDNRFYRLLLIAWGIGGIVLFVIFKQLYPFADFFGDSYSYIFAAEQNLNVSMWPIGYSKFLRLFHFMTDSDTALVAFQYLFLQIAALYFFLSITYFMGLSKPLQLVLAIFLFYNPLFLYISNYINSDPIFLAISLVWFTHLLWIINRPKPTQLITQALLLVVAFSIRNNAYYYPLISILGYGLSKHLLWRKAIGSTLGLVFIMLFVLFSRHEAGKLTGTKQFSLFTGWQLANNALYMYKHVTVIPTLLPSPETRELDSLSKIFFSKTSPNFDNALKSYTGNYFIREPFAPLKRYFSHHFNTQDEYNLIVSWGKANPIFAEFGKSVIKQDPLAYMHHFALLNSVNYFFPPLEKLAEYNLGTNNVEPIAQDWFNYTSTEVTAASYSIQEWVLLPYQVLFMFLNLFSIGGIVWLVIDKKRPPLAWAETRIIILMGSLLLINFFFSVFVTINVLRYQLFPICICLVMASFLYKRMEKRLT